MISAAVIDELLQRRAGPPHRCCPARFAVLLGLGQERTIVAIVTQGGTSALAESLTATAATTLRLAAELHGSSCGTGIPSHQEARLHQRRRHRLARRRDHRLRRRRGSRC